MILYDITQEMFHCQVYPGDDSPTFRKQMDMQKGDPYNLSYISMCCHNGTHIDAPAHFWADGKTVDQMSLQLFVGPCSVICHDGDVSADDARRMLTEAQAMGASERILIKGTPTVTADAARVFAEGHLLLLGNESQTVGPMNSPMEVHHVLLQAEVILLQGIRLDDVPPGRYLLNAAPLNLGGLEGAPCRAWLMKESSHHA